MYFLLQALGGIASLASLVCFILVLIKMFQDGQTGLGVACIVLIFCVGIGAIIAFVVGWLNADRWRIRNVMMIWTVCFVASVALQGLAYAMAPHVVIVR